MKPTTKQPWEKYGITELAYNLAWTQGFLDKTNNHGQKFCTYKKGTGLRKAYSKGYRDGRFKA